MWGSVPAELKKKVFAQSDEKKHLMFTKRLPVRITRFKVNTDIPISLVSQLKP